jgi:APA family basic amino acid/polyamine antiporter
VRDYSHLYSTSDSSHAALQAAMGRTPVQPVMPLYGGINGGAAWLAIAMGLCCMLWFWNTSFLIWLAGVRGIFSMAFDRQLPLRLASVGSKGNPTWANHFLAIFAILGVLMAWGDQQGTSWASQTLALLDFGALIFIWPMVLAAIMLPYVRPDLWGGIPVITIIGVACFLVGWFMVSMVGQYMVFWSYMSIAIMLAVGFISDVWMYNRNRMEGIDPNRIFTEIPPA